MIAGSFNQVTNDQSFQHIYNVGNNKFNFLESAEVSRDNQLSANLKKTKISSVDINFYEIRLEGNYENQ